MITYSLLVNQKDLERLVVMITYSLLVKQERFGEISCNDNIFTISKSERFGEISCNDKIFLLVNQRFGNRSGHRCVLLEDKGRGYHTKEN